MGRWIDPQRPSHMKIFQQRVETAGIHHRAADARRFIDSGGGRSLELEREPTNPHDPNAIKVIGVTGGRRFHIGYVPADLARKIVEGQSWPDVFADLRMVDSGDYVHVVFDLCVPKGSGEKKPKNTIPDDEKITELKKEVRKAERSHSNYQKKYGCKGGLSLRPYQKLAVIYRKQKDYTAEVELLERYFTKNGGGYPEGVTGGEADLFGRLQRAKELLATQEKVGPDSERMCQECGKSPRKLSAIKSGQLVCTTCKRKLEPPRPKHLATEKSIAIARRLGFKVTDYATKEQVSRALDMHHKAHGYAKDVWFSITGQRAPCQKGELTLDQFVTKLFKDRARLQRIVAIQQRREALSEGGREPPPVPQDEDYQLVAKGLRTYFEPVRAGGNSGDTNSFWPFG